MLRKGVSDLTVKMFPLLVNNIWARLSEQLLINNSNLKIFAQLAYGQQGEFGINEKTAYVRLIIETESLLSHILTLAKLFKVIADKFPQLVECSSSAPLLNFFFESYTQNLQAMYGYVKDMQPILKAAYSSRNGDDVDGKYFDDDDDDDDDDNCSYLDAAGASLDMSGIEDMPEERIMPIIRKAIKAMSSTLVSIQHKYPVELVPYLPGLLQFFMNHIHEEYNTDGNTSNDGSFNPSVQSLTIAAVMFLSNTLHKSEYNASTESSNKFSLQKMLTKKIQGDAFSGNTNYAELQAKAFEIKCNYFNEENTRNILMMLLHRFLRYNRAELEEWETDAENFYISQLGLKESETLKSACEGLYLGLLDHNTTAVVTTVVGLLQDIPRQLLALSNNSVEELVFWDAVYLCTGLGATTISKQFNPTEWLTSAIGPLLNHITTSGGRAGMLKNGQQLLRARFMWLLYCWNYLFDASILQTILSVLLMTFDSQYSSDVPTVMHAIAALKSLLYVDTFSSEFLEPMLVPFVQSLCSLASSLEESENRANVVEIISELVRAMRDDAKPMLAPLANHLGTLWGSCERNSPLKTTIIEAITEIVRASGHNSHELQAIALELISYAVSCTVESLFLLKEGISLWLVVSRNINPGSYNQALDDVAKVGLMNVSEYTTNDDFNDSSRDMLKEFLCIMEAYAIISGSSFLLSCANAIQSFYSKHLGQVESVITPFFTRPLEALLLSCPIEAAEFLLQSGILQIMLRSICAKMPAFEDALSSHVDQDLTIVTYLSVIARLMLLQNLNQLRTPIMNQSLDIMVNELQSVGVNTDRETLLHGIIYLLVSKFDNVGYCTAGMWKRKLWCICLLSHYPLATQGGDTFMLETFPEIINISADVLSEEEAEEGIQRSDNMATSMLSVEIEEDDVGDSHEPIVVCLQALLRSDVVSVTSVLSYTKQKLIEMKQTNNETIFNTIMTMIGQDTLNRYTT